MAWFIANWFWMLILIIFVAMHAFGHGGHAGSVVLHRVQMKAKNEVQGRAGRSQEQC